MICICVHVYHIPPPFPIPRDRFILFCLIIVPSHLLFLSWEARNISVNE